MTTTTLTGNPLNFETESAQNASECILTMEPIQDGSGTPSPDNVRAISGRDSVYLTIADDADSPTVTETKNYTFSDTVYGGTLDVNTGVLTVDWSVVTYDGSSDETWSLETTADTPFFHIGANVAGYIATGILLLCETFEPKIISTTNDDLGIYNVPNFIRVRYSSDTTLTVSDLQTWLAENPLRVAYPLSTTTTYQLTPAQVSLLLGTNNISTDADSIELTYSNGTYATLTDIQASEVSILARLDILEAAVSALTS